MDESQLQQQLIGLGEVLDQAVPPVDVEKVLDSSCKVELFTVSSPPPASTSPTFVLSPPRWLRVALAGAAAVLAGALLLLWPTHDRDGSGPDTDDQPPTEPSSPPSAPPTSEPEGRTGELDDAIDTLSPAVDVDLTVPSDAVPEVGVAVEDGEDVVLVSVDGQVLGRGSRPGHPLDSGFSVRTYDFDLGLAWLAPQSLALPPSGGCSYTAGAGGLRTGLCPRTDEHWRDLADQYRTDWGSEIRVIDPSGESHFLASAPAWDPSFGLNRHHGWTMSLPSPDGRWLLADWMGDCRVGTAFLVPTEGDALRTVTGERGLDWMSAPASTALGWTPDGRAIVSLDHVAPDPACDVSAGEPGVYLVDPDSGEVELIRELRTRNDHAAVWHRQHGQPNRRERLLDEAARLLDAETGCCPGDHTYREAYRGLRWEGHDVAVFAGDPDSGWKPGGQPERVELGDYGEAAVYRRGWHFWVDAPLLTFECGSTTYVLGLGYEGQDEPVRLPQDEQIRLLLAVSEAVVPYLYCTMGDPEP